MCCENRLINGHHFQCNWYIFYISGHNLKPMFFNFSTFKMVFIYFKDKLICYLIRIFLFYGLFALCSSSYEQINLLIKYPDNHIFWKPLHICLFCILCSLIETIYTISPTVKMSLFQKYSCFLCSVMDFIDRDW